MPAGPDAASGARVGLVLRRDRRSIRRMPQPSASRSRPRCRTGRRSCSSWCSSMISALSKYGAANSANRIISTALIAKLEAMMQLLPLNSSRKPAMSSSLKPVVPTTACTPCIASHGRVTRAASATVKSTTTSQPASASDRRSPVTVTPWMRLAHRAAERLRQRGRDRDRGRQPRTPSAPSVPRHRPHRP